MAQASKSVKMSKDQTKDGFINMLKAQLDDQKAQNKVLTHQNDEFKKGNTGVEAQLKAANEMHSQKVRTLLKSINNLKKEVAKTKLEGNSKNFQVQKIKRLEKDMSDLEITINALRTEVNEEDKCDQAIMKAITKGPKQVRIASREELKMEINKYKNIS